MKAGGHVIVFYASLVYKEYTPEETIHPHDLPDGVYIHVVNSKFSDMKNTWYLKDLTPVLIADVPKELLLLKLLMT